MGKTHVNPYQTGKQYMTYHTFKNIETKLLKFSRTNKNISKLLAGCRPRFPTEGRLPVKNYAGIG